MNASSPIVTIFGGSGFVGRYIARRMARAGWRVRVAVRRPNEALFVLRPITMLELFEVADAGQHMPPKSTYFSPKARSGVVVRSVT